MLLATDPAGAAASSTMDMKPILHGALLGGVADLGDPTFFLIILLTAWCPFLGLRSMRGASLQRLFVFLGAAGAVALHIVLVMKQIKPKEGPGSYFDLISGLTAVVILALAGLRSLCEFWTSPEHEESHSFDPEANDRHHKKHGSTRSYGATSFMGQDRTHKSSMPVAFLTTMVLVFAMIPNGRWDKLLFQGEPPSVSFAIGAGSGFGVCILFALFCGSVLQASAREQRMRFMITCSLWALVLWTGSSLGFKFYDERYANGWQNTIRK